MEFPYDAIFTYGALAVLALYVWLTPRLPYDEQRDRDELDRVLGKDRQ